MSIKTFFKRLAAACRAGARAFVSEWRMFGAFDEGRDDPRFVVKLKSGVLLYASTLDRWKQIVADCRRGGRSGEGFIDGELRARF